MGACFHIAGVTCDNCRTAKSGTGTIIGPLTGVPFTGDLLGEFDPTPREWTAHPPAIYAEVATLRAEVERLTERVAELEAPAHQHQLAETEALRNLAALSCVCYEERACVSCRAKEALEQR